MPITHYAPPKINFGLHITGRREDGYHELSSLVVFGHANSGDCVTYDPDMPYGLTVEGEFAAATPSDERNLILKMAQLVQAEMPGLVIGGFHLVKSLPVAAGIGGGTMDAIAALRCMQDAHGLPAELCLQLATRIGADGKACWHQCPLVMSGIGEEIGLVELHGPMHLLLVNPRIELETAAVFEEYEALKDMSLSNSSSSRDLTPKSWYSTPDPSLRRSFIDPWGKPLDEDNHLLKPALSLCPAIADVLEFLQSHNPVQFGMSGSGATCYGEFKTRDAAQKALQAMPAQWWGMLA